MPPKTYKKKSSVKKSYRGKRKVFRPRKALSSWNPSKSTSVTVKGLSRPDRLNVKLPYEETITLSGAVFGDHVMQINSLFDPNSTGAGHQPMGFDTWSAMYNRYIVHGVKYDITFVNNSATSISYCGLVASNSAAALTASTSLEQSRGINDIITATTGSKTLKRWSGYFNLASVTGVKKSKYNSDDFYQSVVTTSPSETIALHLFSQDVGLASNINIIIRCRLTFYATFFDPNPMSAS